MVSVWVPVIVAFVAFTGGLVVATANGYFTQRNDRTRWERDTRIEAYVELMTATWLMPGDGGDDRVIDRAKAWLRFTDALEVVTLIASTPVSEAASGLFTAMKAHTDAPDTDGESDNRAKAKAAFHAAARRELGVK